MNFTKQYIKLCKNDKVQGLRKELETDDRFIDKAFYKYLNRIYTYELNAPPLLHDVNENREKIIWLPTSGQLDQCIVDICKRHNLDYQVGTTKKPNYWWWVTTTSRIGDPDENIIMVEAEENPIICKLKLLLSLLESEE